MLCKLATPDLFVLRSLLQLYLISSVRDFTLAPLSRFEAVVLSEVKRKSFFVFAL